MKNLWIPLLALVVLGLMYQQYQNLTSCSVEEKTAHANCASPIQIYEDPSRIPLRSFVLDEMGELKGKTVGDLGAGPGFFAFEMAKTADKVIATELDQLFLNYMEEKKSKDGISNFEILPADKSHKELENLKVDYALMVYVFHYLDNPRSFLEKLKESIHPGGKVFIANAQMSPVIIEDYLEMTGFENISTKSFSYPQPGCGDVEVELVSAQIAGLQAQSSK